MDATEYLAFLPLLIYGIALADLFGQWKRLLEPKGVYAPYLIFTVILTEAAVYNVFVYAELVTHLKNLSYHHYLLKLLPPFLFMLTINVFTPEKGDDTKAYFIKQMPNFFTMLAAFMATHFFYSFGEGVVTIALRSVAIVLVLVAGFTRKIWMCYLFVVIWFLSLFARADFTITM
ncbi:hypothetical protein [Carboxylicivirga sp. M1479]|uniref:hypothetical protein n=1 Tax=Carboxylicivirga sp. M1479 TaxID=2594476 RepID=UPI0011788CEC|nr:hypothetical protein [Carboxylicivirga sp. M1479]TRX70852.1 hypothetical protein FNN09_09320 [Carboxylicivirga sp. M1479]